MRLVLAATTAIGLFSTPVLADDFTETIDLALEAYADGDIDTAKEELDFAAQLLQEMQGENFKTFLPEPMDGWTREDGDNDDAAAMAMFGGGVMANAQYSNGDDYIEIQLMSGNAMVSSFAGMFGNTATMAMMGNLVRVNREKFVDQDGDIQGMVGNVLVSASGSASEEDKIAYLEMIDFEALEDY